MGRMLERFNNRVRISTLNSNGERFSVQIDLRILMSPATDSDIPIAHFCRSIE